MKIADIQKNLSTMGDEERTVAETLLRSLNIAFEKPAPKQRGSFTSKLAPYYERIMFNCTTCGNQYTRHFHFKEDVINGQHLLLAKSVLTADFAVLDLPVKERKSTQVYCKKCHERLAQRPVDELVAALINLRRGGRYAEVTP
jgi:hypothetical protein